MQIDFNVAKLLPSTDMEADIDVVTVALQILLESPPGTLKSKQLVSVELHRIATS